MKISVFGLGYVGCVSIGCLAKSGHEVKGVDVVQHKVDLINNGKPTIVEEGIANLIASGFNSKLISATTEPIEAVVETDVSIIAVGTPSTPAGKLNLDYLFGTASQIGTALREKSTFHLISIRSTVFPGTNEHYGQLIEHYSGKKRYLDFDVVSNPEFLREGSAVHDYYNPPITVIGSSNQKSIEIMKEIYSDINASFQICDIKVAEIIKYVNNSFHALKVVFANEVGSICKELGINSHEVMNLFCMDTKLNLSPYYLKPGFAYGGSCLPKDLKALTTISHDKYISTPVISNIELSNDSHKARVLELILKKNMKKIGIIGLSFKEGTDDLRYSPIVDIAEHLMGKGFDIKIYDENVEISRITGTNKNVIETHIPHLAKLLVSEPEDLFVDTELIIINQRNNRAVDNISNHKTLAYIDLVGISDNLLLDYQGVCW